MLKFHPDKNPDLDVSWFNYEIQDAKEILTDKDKKYVYDVFGRRSFENEERLKAHLER